MNRRTRDKVGNWPNMRDDTLRMICNELIRARKKHPDSEGNLVMLELAVTQLRTEFNEHTAQRMSAAQVYARAIMVAAMAIRCCEEGASNYSYAGNISPPSFELKP